MCEEFVKNRQGNSLLLLGHGAFNVSEQFLAFCMGFVLRTCFAMSIGAPPLPGLHLEAINYSGPPQMPDKGNGPGPILTGKGVGVAVIDTGVTLKDRHWLLQSVRAVYHVSLEGPVVEVYRNPRATPGDSPVPERPVTNYGDDPHGHGTVMAELIGRPGMGMAVEVDLYCYRIPAHECDGASGGEDGKHSSSYDFEPLLWAMRHAQHNDAVQVVSISLSSIIPDTPSAYPNSQGVLHEDDEGSFAEALRELRCSGKAVILTAGNSPPTEPHDQHATGVPGRAHLDVAAPVGAAVAGESAARQAVTVGSASWDAVNGWRRSGFSLSFHRVATQRYVPDVYAPGEGVPVFNDSESRSSETPFGTSIATAITSGMVALGLELMFPIEVKPNCLVDSDLNRLYEAIVETGPFVFDQHQPPAGAVRVIDVRKFLSAL